jgi:signal transduction histidine kinase
MPPQRGRLMKKTLSILACFGFLFMFCAGTSVAREKATKEECIAKCKEAIALIKEVGLEAALAKIQDPKGPFVWKDSYVYVLDMEGKMLANPVVPDLVGKPSMGLKDANGKMFVNQIIEVAKSGADWVPYMWPKPGEKAPSSKLVYVLRVPGEDAVVCAGIYE